VCARAWTYLPRTAIAGLLPLEQYSVPLRSPVCRRLPQSLERRQRPLRQLSSIRCSFQRHLLIDFIPRTVTEQHTVQLPTSGGSQLKQYLHPLLGYGIVSE
jgi:hypothetical protein